MVGAEGRGKKIKEVLSVGSFKIVCMGVLGKPGLAPLVRARIRRTICRPPAEAAVLRWLKMKGASENQAGPEDLR